MSKQMKELIDELYLQGKTWEEIVKITMCFREEQELAELTAWFRAHPQATRQEIMAERHRLIIKHHLS